MAVVSFIYPPDSSDNVVDCIADPLSKIPAVPCPLVFYLVFHFFFLGYMLL